MKTIFDKSISTFSAVLILSVLSWCSASGLAQGTSDAGDSKSPARTITSPTQSPAWGGLTINPSAPPPTMIDPKTGLPVPVEFPEVIRTNRIKELNVDNLTFSETANCLRKAFPEVNFVIAESIRKQQEQFGLPIRLDLRLRNAALRDILNSISYATDGKILWHLVGENIVVFELRPDLIAATSAMHPPSNPVRSVQVFNLSQILRGLDKMECEKVLEDVNKLTYNTLERLHDGENISSQMPRCNYHPETGVLILIGPDSANKLFFDILRNVDASRRAPAKDPSAGKTEALENPAVSSKPAVPSSPK